MIAFVCPECSETLHIPDKYVGMSGTCGHCGSHIVIDIDVDDIDVDDIDVDPLFAMNEPPSPFSTLSPTQKNEQLLLATANGDLTTAKGLISAGAAINCQDPRGKTPLHFAICMGSLDLTRFLIDHSAYVNAVDRSGCTPLHDAASRGFCSIALLLLQNDANVNARDKQQETPLHYAARSTPGLEAAKNMVNLLLHAGAQINSRSHGDRTPLTDAAELGYSEIETFLRSHGAVK